MPTTTSIVTLTNINGSNIGAPACWATSDDTRNNPSFHSSTGDITLIFGNLNVPSGATINGLAITVEGQGSNFATTPEIFLYNGSSNSSGINANTAFNKSDSLKQYGSSTELWGLSWTNTTANAVVATIDVSTIASGVLYWDYVLMTVTYTEGLVSNGMLKIDSGLVQINNGRVVL
tara:strand:+ start:43 stop:570 length:528 start_codon:yes stop_codon:yes gene_type:complete